MKGSTPNFLMDGRPIFFCPSFLIDTGLPHLLLFIVLHSISQGTPQSKGVDKVYTLGCREITSKRVNRKNEPASQ